MDLLQIQPKRVFLFDWLKCISLLSMIAYHTIYDVVYIFGVDLAWFRTQGAFYWQQSICWTFILVSGAVLPYSRKPLRHGLVLFGGGMLLTAVTLLAMPSERILFGILHFLGIAAIITALLAKVFAKVPAAVGMIVCFLLFLLCYEMPYGYLGIFTARFAALPQGLYASPYFFWLGFLPRSGFYSADYFPVLPWIFLYWTGYFAWQAAKNTSVETAVRRVPPTRITSWIARRSLWIYLLHQPLIYAACLLIFR